MYFLSDNFKNLVQGKWLLWDTCALIRLVNCDADALMNYLSENVSENVSIKPVSLELMATKDQKESLKRALFYDKYITDLKTNLDTPKDTTKKIQERLPRLSQPGAVDLMLASTLAQYGESGRMLFVTENIKDFPSPLFKKEGFLMVSNDSKSYGLTLLSINLELLA